MRFAVGLSGGADSAAVALSLLEAGHEVAGVFLRLFDEADESPARHVADKLGIELHVVDACAAFSESVIADFVSEYARGRTPNPCAKCNREMKIRLLCEAAEALGCDKVATGHYAGIGEEAGRFFVLPGEDASRDQSYFLWRLSQEQLKKLVFVLFREQKQAILPRVRRLLFEGVRESREVCFIPEGDRIAFLLEHLPEEARRRGVFVDEEGRELAPCEGVFRYTVGQRRGFGVGFGRRVYVKAIDAESGRVVLSSKEGCERASCLLSQMNFQYLPGKTGEYPVLCRARYRAPLLPATLTVFEAGGALKLEGEARAVLAAGQSLVCYDAAGRLLCGGIIENDETAGSSF